MANYEVGLVQKGLIFSLHRILGRFRLPVVAAVGGAEVVVAVAVGLECASTVKVSFLWWWWRWHNGDHSGSKWWFLAYSWRSQRRLKGRVSTNCSSYFCVVKF